MKFKLGQVFCTKGALNKLNPIDIKFCLGLHANGMWGNLCEEDKQANEDALIDGDRILSSYTSGKEKIKFWIITEWDRSVTTVLLPEEY